MKRNGLIFIGVASALLFGGMASMGTQPDEYFTKYHDPIPAQEPDTVPPAEGDSVAHPGDMAEGRFHALQIPGEGGDTLTINLFQGTVVAFPADSLLIESAYTRHLFHQSALPKLRFAEATDSAAIPQLVAGTMLSPLSSQPAEDPDEGADPTEVDNEDAIYRVPTEADGEEEQGENGETAPARLGDWLHVRAMDSTLFSTPLNRLREITFAPTERPTVTPGRVPSGDPGSYLIGSDTLYISSETDPGRLAIETIDSLFIGTNVPSIHIDIEEGKEVESKTDWLTATISLEGFGEYEDFPQTDITIRGRGNSTWGYPKKPYRIKFSKKQSLCGLKKAKNFVLLANFLDGSMMKNAVAFKISGLLGMPYSPHNIPVNLYVNGCYRGAYTLNEKMGINAGSVDIDGEKGIMWELDSYFDEDFRYKTPVYDLPAMVKDPDLEEICEDNPEKGTAEEYFQFWQEDFNAMERGVAACDSTLTDYIDLGQAARFVLVQNVCANIDFNHPKSIYLYKESPEEVYKFGPVWDFDWGFTFRGMYSAENTGRAEQPLLHPEYATPGIPFWQAIFDNPLFMEEYGRVWEEFRTELYPELMEWFEEYVQQIEATADQDARVWNVDTTHPQYHLLYQQTHREKVAMLREFLRLRMAYLEAADNYGLY